MAKQYEITKIEYNQKMSGKYAGAFLHTKNIENDKPRKDFVFENSKQFKVLQECAVGNIVELKIVKNGDYFNLAKDDDAIVLVSKEKKEPEVKPEVKQEAIEPTPVKEYTKYKEDPEKQAAIIRQNALTNATNFVCASMTLGCGTETDLVKTIIATAIQFAKYTSGEDMTEYLMAPAPWEGEGEPDFNTKAPKGRKPKDIPNSEPESGRDIPRGEFGE